MKSKLFPLFAATLILTQSARSAQFTWDGGTGTWDTTTTDWGGSAWGNTNADEAVFGGTAGTVTISTGAGVIANKVTFNTDGYVINGNTSSDVLNLAGTTPTANVAASVSTAINAVISGTTGLTKAGAGTLILNGANTYTGTTTLSGGTLVVGHVDALSTVYTGSGASTLRLATDTSVTAFQLNSGTNNSYTVVADRATSGAAFTHVLGSSSLGGGTSTITFQTGSNVTSGTSAVSLSSLTLSAGSTNLTTTLNPTTATVTIVGNVDRTSGLIKTLKLDGTIAGNTIDGVISNGTGAGASMAVTKSNTSTWTLNNTASTYTGVTTISAGALEAASLANGGSNSSIGASTNAATNLVFGASSAILRYIGSSNVTTDRGFTTSSGTGGGATIESSGTGTLGLDNTVAIALGTTNQTRTITLGGSNTGSNTFSKVLANNGTSATSLTKNGTGTWTLDGTAANTHTGTTAINGGMLILAKTGVNAIGGNLTIGNAGVGLDYLQLGASDQIVDTSVATFNGSGSNAGIFQLNNQNETLAGIVSAGGAGIVENGNTSAGTSTLTVSVPTNTSHTYSGVLQDNGGSGSGILALTKAGAGTLILTGTGTYTGVTTVNTGTLRIGTVTALYNGVAANWTPANITVSSGSALGVSVGGPGEFGATDVTNLLGNLGALGGAVNNNGFRAGSIVSFDTTNAAGGTFTVADTIANSTGTGGGAVSLTKTGTNTLVLSGASTYSGTTSISGGALQITNGAALGSTSGTTNVQTGTLELSGNITTNEPLTLQGNNTAASADRVVNVGGDNILAGKISPGPGGDKHGLRSDSGKLTVSADIEGTASGNRFLYLRGSATGEITGKILAGAGNTALLKEGTGTWTLSGANTYTGSTTVSAGTLHFAAGSSTSAITVSSGAFIGFTLGSSITSTSTLTLDPGSAVKITGTPTLPSYTLFTGTSPVSGTPVLDVAIPGYSLVADGNSLKLNATGGSGFSSWITGTFANGTVPGGQQGPNDDPDGDGVSNLVEYAVAGLDPTVSNGAVGTFSGLTLTFTKRSPLAADISYIIETSPSLQPPWTPQVTQGIGNTDPTISYTLPTGGGKLFARLKVEQ